jgi:hypothetical protein
MAAIPRSGCPFMIQHFTFILPPPVARAGLVLQEVFQYAIRLALHGGMHHPARGGGDAGSRLDIRDGGPAA